MRVRGETVALSDLSVETKPIGTVFARPSTKCLKIAAKTLFRVRADLGDAIKAHFHGLPEASRFQIEEFDV